MTGWFRQLDEDFRSSRGVRAAFFISGFGAAIPLAEYLAERSQIDFLIDFPGNLAFGGILGFGVGIPTMLAYRAIRRRFRR
jgi:hypothetical protein